MGTDGSFLSAARKWWSGLTAGAMLSLAGCAGSAGVRGPDAQVASPPEVATGTVEMKSGGPNVAAASASDPEPDETRDWLTGPLGDGIADRGDGSGHWYKSGFAEGSGLQAEVGARASSLESHRLGVPLDDPAPDRSGAQAANPLPRDHCSEGLACSGPVGLDIEESDQEIRDRYLRLYSTEVFADVEMNLRADSRAILQWVIPLSD